ncbi:MAG: Ppx/GppA phosphatase family protein [Gemmatimonadaceae bacterium]
MVSPRPSRRPARSGARPRPLPETTAPLPEADPAGESTRIAAIDIGSNSIRQVVADVAPDGTIRLVDEMKAAPRLGAGVQRTGVLSALAADEAVDALTRMAALARALGASHIELVATSAVREASNGAEFAARAERATGVALRIIEGEEEARLSWRSAAAHFDLSHGRAVVVDIGGGSLELAASVDGLLEQLASVAGGAIRLTERFLGGGSHPAAVRQLRQHVRRLLRDTLPRAAWRGARLIGSGGTFTNLAGVHMARVGHPTKKNVHGTAISRADVEHALELLASLSLEERRALPGLNPQRADIIVAGVAAVAEVMARLDSPELLVSRYGIREGILLEAARVPARAQPGRDARARSVQELADRSRYEPRHAQQVLRLALRLFDTLGDRLGCAPEERQLLADAALLHDIGYHISYERHHKHSYHLIAHAELLGMSPADRLVVANVARYHRGKEPRKKHAAYGELDRLLRARVRRLAALLRVADGLDRGHVAAVGELKVRRLQQALRLQPVPVVPGAPLRLELWGAHRKSGLLAKLLGVPVELVASDGTVYSSAALRAKGAAGVAPDVLPG